MPSMNGYTMGLLMWWSGPQGPIYLEEFRQDKDVGSAYVSETRDLKIGKKYDLCYGFPKMMLTMLHSRGSRNNPPKKPLSR